MEAVGCLYGRFGSQFAHGRLPPGHNDAVSEEGCSSNGTSSPGLLGHSHVPYEGVAW